MQYSVVQVSQYSCDDEYVAAQIGCFQYFTGLTGTLQSYNFAGAAQIKVQTRLLQCCSVLTRGLLQGHNYKNCVRAEEGYCCIQYDVVTWAVNAATCADATANR